MPKTLYAKLSIALTAILATIGVVYALLTLSATRHYLEATEQSINRDLARNLVADRNLVAEGRLNEAAVKEMFHDYMTINPSIEIYLLDLDGRILSFSADPGKVKRKHVSLAPIGAFLNGTVEFPLLGDDPRSHDGRKTFSVTAVPSARAPEGYLYVVLLGERVDSIAALMRSSYIARFSGFALAGSLVLGLVAGLILFRVLTARLNRLTDRLDELRASDFHAHVPFATGADAATEDEIDRLGKAYDEMAGRIIAQVEALEQKDALRREMVAHVSHDLRTPLASLHGYIETLKLKAGELDDEERARYLDVALTQSHRLRRLVQDLFELATLDAREQTAELESIALPDLVNDVVQKFHLRAEARGTHLTIEAPEDLPWVSADVALVDRALSNLLDNALSHTPEGGHIRVLLSRAGADTARIAVEDDGPGISAEDLPRIFDRFYQVGNEHRGTSHAGLGLAIAKRIAELHDSDLDVASERGHGATFSFLLPAARAA